MMMMMSLGIANHMNTSVGMSDNINVSEMGFLFLRKNHTLTHVKISILS